MNLNGISLKSSQAFNPPAVGGGDAFDSKGELNAWNRQDAVTQLSNVLTHLINANETEGRTLRASKTMTAAQRQEYFTAVRTALESGEEGMRMVGQELLNPIREVLDYDGYCRKVLAPREVGPGEIPRYDRDQYATAWVVAADGITPENRGSARYFYPPEFMVTAYSTLNITDIYQMQYDSLARMQDRTAQAVMFKEDSALINLLDSASTTVNSLTYVSSFDWNALFNLRYQIEKNRLPCDKFLVNMSEIRDMMVYINYQHLDPVTMRELILKGYIGNIAGVQLIANAGNGIFEPVPPGTVYAVSRPEFVGGMPIRVPLQTEPINRFLLGEAVKGWFFYEMISQVVLNPRGVAKAVKL